MTTEAVSPLSHADFDGMIGVPNLLTLVHNTAAFAFDDLTFIPPATSDRMIELCSQPFSYLTILDAAKHWDPTRLSYEHALEDYFAICLSAHHATVATFVPTDVDSKIRGLLWRKQTSLPALMRMLDAACETLLWNVSRISRRYNEHSGVGPVSGHNGEHIGILAGGLGCFIAHQHNEYISKAAEVIDAELTREAHEFMYVARQKGMEIELLQLSSSLTHNVGDLDQGISYWEAHPGNAPYQERFSKLAHHSRGSYNRAFDIAAALYKAIMAPEGHRHYPLREVPALRRSVELLLPLSPILDDWGSIIGSTKILSDVEKAQTLAALCIGCHKIKNQRGYFRAIAGMCDTLGGRIDQIAKLMPSQAKNCFKDADLRKQIAVSKGSFEASLRKKAQEILKEFGLR